MEILIKAIWFWDFSQPQNLSIKSSGNIFAMRGNSDLNMIDRMYFNSDIETPNPEDMNGTLVIN